MVKNIATDCLSNISSGRIGDVCREIINRLRNDDIPLEERYFFQNLLVGNYRIV